MAGLQVSVVMPVRQEEKHIADAVASLAPQVEAVNGELVVAEGGSTDSTRRVLEELAGRYAWLRIVDNPQAHPATGLNRAIGAARGEIIIRADAHSEYAPNYLRRVLEVLAGYPAPAVVGGRLNPRGTSAFARAVAAAMTSPVAVGPGSFHHATQPGPADTVYLGAFPKSLISQMDGYRAFPSRAGEDADFCARVRRAGFGVWLDPSIESTYRPRRSPAALARQSWRYGMAKAEILRASGSLPSWRPLAPATLVLLLGRSAIGRRTLTSRAVVLGWIGSLVLAARSAERDVSRPLFIAAAATMQVSYGLGFWFSLFRTNSSQPLVGPAAGWVPDAPTIGEATHRD